MGFPLFSLYHAIVSKSSGSAALLPARAASPSEAHCGRQTLLGAGSPSVVLLERSPDCSQRETVVSQHRSGFRWYWSMLSKVRRTCGRKKASREIRDLIFTMVAGNPRSFPQSTRERGLARGRSLPLVGRVLRPRKERVGQNSPELRRRVQGRSIRRKRTLSAAARRKIAAAQRARWAGVKAAKKSLEAR